MNATAPRTETTPLQQLMPAKEYASLDRAPRFTPTHRFNGYTLNEIRAYLGLVGYDDLSDEFLVKIGNLLTKPRHSDSA